MSVSLTQDRTENQAGSPPARPEAAMKLLFVHQRRGAFGGAEANIRITAQELKQRGHLLELLYAEGTGRGEEAIHSLFTRCHPLPQGKDALRALLAKCAPDLIYLHSLEDLQAMETLFESALPVIRMVHDHSLYCLRGYKYNPLTRAPCSRPASGHCIFPCLAPIARNRSGSFPFKWASFGDRRKEIKLNKQCEALITYSRHSKGELIGNGFDPSRIHIHVPMECLGDAHPISTFSDRNLVLFAGQIIRGKGVDLLLRALSKLRVGFEGIIAGDGNHRPHCEKLCSRLGLADKIRFTGYLPPPELEKLYLDASVFVFPSVWPEPFGMAGPEAMRFGLPVVGFDTGGVREWLQDGQSGFLAPWADVTQFASRIEQLLRDKHLARRLGLHGRARVNREYQAARQIDGLERLFAETIRAKKAKGPLLNARDLPGLRQFEKPVLRQGLAAAEPVLNL